MIEGVYAPAQDVGVVVEVVARGVEVVQDEVRQN
jgi:hypothetical protein